VTENEILHRSYDVELEAGEGRTVEGKAVPYGEVAEVVSYGKRHRESFEAGAFRRATRSFGRMELLVEHRDESAIDAIGVGISAEEREDGLYGSWRIYDGAIGDHVLERVQGGALRGLSIGFRPLGPGRRLEDGTLVRTACHLDEVSLTRAAAYLSAVVTAVRSAPEVELDELVRPLVEDEELEERLRKLGLRG
jgi:Escherichia/Staphylococcus phage prohead protease